MNFRYTLEDDWSGDPAIFFWVTLSDEAARMPKLSDNADRIQDLVTQRVDFAREWDLIPYFSFRSQSEQAKLKDEKFG